ncbi:unnamed protein product [Discosporangium mesarthrocarpum]
MRSLPGGNPDVTEEQRSRRQEVAILHKDLPLAVGELDGNNSLEEKITVPPALVIFSPGKILLGDSPSVGEHLKTLVSNIAECMHSAGTLAVILPHPWAKHMRQIEDLLALGALKLSLEEEPLYIKYSTLLPGRVSREVKNHLRSRSDCVLLAHKKTPTGFICNSHVSPENSVFGREKAPSAFMECERARNDKDIPEAVVKFLVRRYSRAGDTILSLPGEGTEAIEISLSNGRRCEVFARSNAKHGELEDRLETAFGAAWRNDGYFKRVQQQQPSLVVLGREKLPDGFPESNIPEKVAKSYEAALLSPSAQESTAALGLAKSAATKLMIVIQDCDSGGNHVMSLPERELTVENHIPIWGDYMVFKDRQAAFNYYKEELGGAGVRLVQVAQPRQLQGMLDPGAKMCGPQGALYMKVHPTCPVYHMETAAAQDANMEISCNLPAKISSIAKVKETLAPPTARQMTSKSGFPVIAQARQTLSASLEGVRLHVAGERLVVDGFVTDCDDGSMSDNGEQHECCSTGSSDSVNGDSPEGNFHSGREGLDAEGSEFSLIDNDA